MKVEVLLLLYLHVQETTVKEHVRGATCGLGLDRLTCQLTIPIKGENFIGKFIIARVYRRKRIKGFLLTLWVSISNSL